MQFYFKEEFMFNLLFVPVVTPIVVEESMLNCRISLMYLRHRVIFSLYIKNRRFLAVLLFQW